jgi:hypothetical protein
MCARHLFIVIQRHMKRYFITALLFFTAFSAFAQEDYFYAEQLTDEGKHDEAVVVLTRLIDSNVYVSRPGLHMKTLNLAGSVNISLHDTTRAEHCYRSVILYYDSLNNSNRKNDFIRRERYEAYLHLAQSACLRQDHATAIRLLNECGAPDAYHSAGDELQRNKDDYYTLKANAYQQSGQADSAFWNLCQVQVNNPLYVIGQLLSDPKNKLVQVASVFFGKTSIGDANTSYGYLYAATWSDEFSNLNTVWAMNYLSEEKVLLGQSSSNSADLSRYPHSVDALHLSTDERWLAVAIHGHESNSIELIDFNELQQSKNYSVHSRINAYPGTLTVLGWEESTLKLQSDADLIQLNRKEKLSAGQVNASTSQRTFIYNIERKKFERPRPYSKATEAAIH